MATLDEILRAFEPTEAQKAAARRQALVTAGLGLLGTTKGNEWRGVGRAGLLGIADYNNQLYQQAQQRQDNLKLMAAAQQMQMQQNEMNRRLAAAQMLSGSGGQGSLRDQLKAAGVSDTEIALAQASDNPVAAAAKLLEKAREPVFGQGKLPMLRQSDGSYRVAVPTGYNEALAAQAKAEAEAKAAVETQNEFIDYPVGNGQTIKITKADALRRSMPSQPPASLPQKAPQFHGTMTPADVNRAMQDYTGQVPFEQQFPQGTPGMGGPGVTASPIAIKGAEERVVTQEQGRRELNKASIGQVDKSYETASQAATQGIPLVHEALSILDSGKVITGAGAGFFKSMGAALSQAGFKAADDPVANTQAFAATQARQVLTIIKSLGSGSGISDADREYAAKIVGGDITLNEGAIRKLLDISERVQRAQIDAHNKRARVAAKLQDNPDIQDFYNVNSPGAYVRKQAMPAAPAAAGGWQYLGPKQ